jgi:hypothetical protein
MIDRSGSLVSPSKQYVGKIADHIFRYPGDGAVVATASQGDQRPCEDDGNEQW